MSLSRPTQRHIRILPVGHELFLALESILPTPELSVTRSCFSQNTPRNTRCHVGLLQHNCGLKWNEARVFIGYCATGWTCLDRTGRVLVGSEGLEPPTSCL